MKEPVIGAIDGIEIEVLVAHQVSLDFINHDDARLSLRMDLLDDVGLIVTGQE